MACEEEAEGDGGVEVRPGDVSQRCDPGEDHQPEYETNADDAERAVGVRVGDDRATAGEHQCKGADALGGRPA